MVTTVLTSVTAGDPDPLPVALKANTAVKRPADRSRHLRGVFECFRV
jgi:hypothetical protein